MQKGKELLEQDKPISNIKLRIFSSFFIVLFFTISILWARPFFCILIFIAGICMLMEWYEITNSRIIYLLIGLIIIPIPITALLLMTINEENKWLLLTYFVAIWSVDTFAMIGGKKLKGPLLAPIISPNKRWSGLIVGALSSGIFCSLLSMLPSFTLPVNYFGNKIYLISACICLGVLAQISDLFISIFKRKFKVKDSGILIPGHGGALDRFDSIILTAPLLFLIGYEL